MKTVARTLIILFFVAVVVAGTYAFSTTDWADELTPTGRQLGGGGRDQADSSSEETGQGQGHRRGQIGESGGGGGGGNHFDMEGNVNTSTMTEFLQTLVPLTIIIVVFTLVRKAYDSIRRKRRRSALQT
jgi:hypothetical protein